MSLQVGYMGTKRFLAPHVREVVSRCPQGPVLDLFAGMGSVGQALCGARPLWVNDAQRFAAEVGRALFTSKKKNVALSDFSSFNAALQENKEFLGRRFSSILSKEKKLLGENSAASFLAANNYLTANSKKVEFLNEVGDLRLSDDFRVYGLFSAMYAGKYFSLEQSIEIDSIRFAIEKTVQGEDKAWLLIALGVAMLKISASTGHFAQYLTPNVNNYKFIGKQRRRSAEENFWLEVARLEPIGDVAWRKNNKAFCGDALKLLPKLASMKDRPVVIYADPPYKDDQYSRYYHLWETMWHYDYPETSGKAGYRVDRGHSLFSVKTKVVGAIDSLASMSSSIGAQLVMSYPANGLLSSMSITADAILKKYYKKVDRVFELEHAHSTMGASSGVAKNSVTEILYLARN